MNSKIKVTEIDNSYLVELQSLVEIRNTHDQKSWSAICHGLRVFGYGTDKNAAVEDLKNALTCFFKLNLKNKRLDIALSKLGWEKQIVENISYTTASITPKIGDLSKFESIHTDMKLPMAA